MKANDTRAGLLFSLVALLALLNACVPAEQVAAPTLASTVPLPTASFTFTSTPTQAVSPTQTHTASPTSSGQVQLIAVGDIMLARTVGEQILEKGPQIVFEGVQEALDAGDLRLGNLECALTDVGEAEDKVYNLIAPPEAVQALSLGKFDLLSLANNHALDNGPVGLAETMRNLDQAGIAYVGAGANEQEAHTPVFIQKNGLRMAFLAYVDVPEERDGFDTRAWIATDERAGVAWAETEQIIRDVIAARQLADVVVVMLHSGNEIAAYIPSINPNQHQAARAAIDAGAALVVGSHPHVLQSIELYHGGLIAYSLGNFVFDQYLGVANATVILRVWLDRDGFDRYDTVPVLINNGFPHVITPDLAPAIATLVAPVVSP